MTKSAIVIGIGILTDIAAGVAFFTDFGNSNLLARASYDAVILSFLGALSLIGVGSTLVARRAAAPGSGRRAVTAISGAIFAFILFFSLVIIIGLSSGPN